MTLTNDLITAALKRVALPDGGDLISRDLIRAIQIDGSAVRFVIEAPTPEAAQAMGPVREAAQAAVAAVSGVDSVQVALPAPSRRTARPSRRGFSAFWPLARARAVWANPPCRRTWPWRWPNRAARWGCWMPIFTDPRSRA